MMLQIEKLEMTCRVVLQRVPTLAVLSIPWMHFTNSREPAQQKLLSKKKTFILILILLRHGWLLLKCPMLAFSIARLRLQLRKEFLFLKQRNFEVIAKTWCFGMRQEKNGNDFYYGDLQKKLKELGSNTLLLCGNVKEKNTSSFAKAHVATDPLPKLPEFYLVSPLRILQMGAKQIASAWILYCLGWVERDALTRSVFFEASVDCLRIQVTLSGLYYWIGKKCVSIWRPKSVLTLYEGHAWEKCLWSGVKEQYPLCKTVGYQHTVILQRTLALRKPYMHLKWCCTPDIILSNGYQDAKILQESHSEKEVSIIRFGSFHSSHDSLVKRSPDLKGKVVLVLSDVPVEARFIFDEAIQAAILLKDYHFVFRPHPSHSRKAIGRYLKKPMQRLSNIEISCRLKVQEDIDRSAVVFYRGTTAIFNAVLQGLKPIALHREGLEVIDPLFDLKIWRETVSSGEDLADCIKRFSRNDPSRASVDWKEAAEYVRSFTVPVEDKAIEFFLKTIKEEM